MLQPRHSPALGASAEHRLAAHALFAFARGFVWRLLDRYGVPEGDRDDLLQDVVIDALLKWGSYRADAGAPGQWLRGMVRNHVRTYWRQRRRRPIPIGEPPDTLIEARTPEDIVAKERLLSTLPLAQRRVVIFYEELGFNYREIAEIMGISKSEAERLHKRALAALVVALRETGERSTDIASILAVADFDEEPTPGPSPEAVARMWDRIVAEGLVDNLVDLAANLEPPPSSGPRPRRVGAAPPSSPRPSSARPSRVPWRWGHRGSRALLMVAGVLVAAKLAPEPDAARRSEAERATAAALPAIGAPEVLPLDATEPATPRPTPRAARTAPPSPPAEVLAVPHYPDRLAQVRERLRSARSALRPDAPLTATCAGAAP